MINRRTLIAVTSAGITSAALGTGLAVAQESDGELEVQNASFIRDLAAGAIATPAEATPSVAATPELDLDELHGYILGDPDAPNTLQVFADYRCPHCRIFHADIEPGLLEDFVLPGRMNLELFDFTVIGVPDFDSLTDDSIESVQAAEASACAAEQGEYLAYRDWLYEGELRTSDGDFSDENLIAAADELGLDTNLFAASLLDGVYEPGVIAMVTYGLERGVRGTPTMILNGGEPFFVPNDGYEALKEQLESELL